ncbi:fatty acid-binding protein DegV [Marinilactibacillus sp. 15R]|uniref:EDD domain protein, DegV family n=1 Tax=Marinilactibacillus piezotolerans TaxID=258723 RepID=A0A1I3X176_9LACT|nr:MULTISPECIES: DegV family protein [Marinilactibacillus]API88814.1 fatty acid-binding protein DegV [Marinilactibacillus sp. 15R]SFK12606.1 EDD domain protein, DegV family [Marinilactibacillus piezotolerans]
MSIAVVTDSTAYLSHEQYDLYNIYSVPLSCIVQSEVYKEEIDITSEEFFLRVREMDKLPTSSQPTVGDFTALYEELGKEYDAIISIHLSSGISGTYQNAVSVSQAIEHVEIYPYDSELAAAGQAFQVIEAAKLAQKGATVEEILKKLDQIKEATELYFVVDDLTNLVKGGRLSRAAGSVATLLSIKPVLTFVDGLIVPFDKIRTKKKALRKIENLLEESVRSSDYPIQATVVHAFSEQEGLAFKENLETKFPDVEFNLSFLGPVIGVHTGEGAIGMTWTIKTSDE